MGRHLPLHTAPNLGAYELRKAVRERGLANLARFFGAHPNVLTRYCNGSRSPHWSYRELFEKDLGIPQIFWEILLVPKSPQTGTTDALSVVTAADSVASVPDGDGS